MDEPATPKLRRMVTEIDLNRSISSQSLHLDHLDDMIFKSPAMDSMTPKRRRKRHRTDIEDDTVSLRSFSLADEPKKRRRSSLARMGSLTNLLSPIRQPVKKVLQKSLSLRNLMSPSSNSNKYQVTPYKKPTATKQKCRDSSLWVETVDDDDRKGLNSKQIERQEAIYELYRNELELIDDLNMIKVNYYEPLKKLNLLSEDEVTQIFGQIGTLKPMHEDLVDDLRNQRLPNGHTDSIGQQVLDWVWQLEKYIPYCGNQIYAKALLDDKKRSDPGVEDFLERCQDSAFSRRLDLWSFLDIPRSRLVKYPLLFKNITKLSPVDHEDIETLTAAVKVVEDNWQSG